MKDAGDFSKEEDRAGRNLHFGVRELAMAAIEMASCYTAVCVRMYRPSLYSVITANRWQDCLH